MHRGACYNCWHSGNAVNCSHYSAFIGAGRQHVKTEIRAADPKSGRSTPYAAELRRRIADMEAAAAQKQTAWVDEVMNSIVCQLEDFLHELEVQLERDGVIATTKTGFAIRWKGGQPALHLRTALFTRLISEGFSVFEKTEAEVLIMWDERKE